MLDDPQGWLSSTAINSGCHYGMHLPSSSILWTAAATRGVLSEPRGRHLVKPMLIAHLLKIRNFHS